MEEEARYCDYCGGELDEDEGTWVGDEVLCQDCVDEQCVTCDHCGEAISTQQFSSDPGKFSLPLDIDSQEE